MKHGFALYAVFACRYATADESNIVHEDIRLRYSLVHIICYSCATSSLYCITN